MARDNGLPGSGGRRARGGSSGRKRGIGHLVLVPDPGDEYVGEGAATAGPGVAEPEAESGDKGQRRGGRRSRPGNPVGADPRAAAPGSASSGGLSSGGRGSGGGSFDGADLGSEEAARAICLRQLTSGPRTRAQLATALRKRRVPDEVAESVLSRFTEVGLIDDAAFARAWVESRHHGRGLARRALSAELRQRGIPDGEVRSAVSLLGPLDELDTARWLVAKRMTATRGKPIPARARQLMGMLARKGYPASLAAQVVREALEQEREALEQEQEDDPEPQTDLAWISEDADGDDWS